jgi:hypothetical protein
VELVSTSFLLVPGSVVSRVCQSLTLFWLSYANNLHFRSKTRTQYTVNLRFFSPGLSVCLAGLLALAAALAGCGKSRDIQVYRVAKDEPAQASLPAGHPEMGAAQNTGETAAPRVEWKSLPAGWGEVTPGEMRVASFRVKGDSGKVGDVGIFPLPGPVGNELANVNRWRGQVGEAPVTEDKLAALAQPVQIANENAKVYEQAGTNPTSGDKTRILAAILRRGQTTWFFKMNGDDDLVAQQKPAFFEFLKGLSFPEGEAQAQLPPSHPAIDQSMAAASAGAASSQDKPQWQVPSGWKEIPGGQFLVAKFEIAGAENATANVNVSMSAGEGGGLAGNVNRWRGQLGLTPWTDDDIAKQVSTVNTPAGQARFVDMNGTDPRSGQKVRLVGAIVPQAGRTWFYKLMGPETLVAREKDAFQQFVANTKYSS